MIILLGLFSYMKNTIKQENEIEKKLDARSLGASVMNGNIRRSGIYSGVRKKRSWLIIR